MIHQTFENLPETKKKALLDAAMDEFITNGYEKSSINRILSDAGIPKGSFYQYFDGKEDLLNACMDTAAAHIISYKNDRDHPLLLSMVTASGYENAKQSFRMDLSSALSEKEQKLVQVLLQSPDFIRLQGFSHLSWKWIEPEMQKEVQKMPELEGIDKSYAAYLLSQCETLSLNYVLRAGKQPEAALEKTYEYLKYLYAGIRSISAEKNR